MDSGRHFTQAEFLSDPRRVMAAAEKHGRATVIGADGKPRLIIGAPRVDASSSQAALTILASALPLSVHNEADGAP